MSEDNRTRDFVLCQTIKNLTEIADKMPHEPSRSFARAYSEQIEAIASPVINMSDWCEKGIEIFGYIFPMAQEAQRLEYAVRDDNYIFECAYVDAKRTLNECIENLYKIERDYDFE